MATEKGLVGIVEGTAKKLEHLKLEFPTQNEGNQKLPVHGGKVIFVIGANGSGKSSLLQKFYTDNRNYARRIMAYRQTLLKSNASDLSPTQKHAMDQSIAAQDAQARFRCQDSYAQQRVSVTLFEFIDSDNAHARKIRDTVYSADECELKKLKRKPTPLSRLNSLLKMGHLPIDISVGSSQQLFASKNNSDPYSIAELSDGERNTVLLAADVLTAPPGTLILIDEPERHLHRSIASPLLLSLFEERQDCAFVISTHDVSLSMDIPHAATLLLRSCTWEKQNATAWDSDIVDTGTDINDDTMRAILGARRKILFVEGDANSTDSHTYSILYPDISVIPRGNCTNVDRTVAGIRNSEDLHWVKAYGLIDRDNRQQEEVGELAKRGIFALDCYSVESLYYSNTIMQQIAERQLNVSPIMADLSKAKKSIVGEVSKHKRRLCALLIEKQVRNAIQYQLPTHQSLLQNPVLCIKFDASGLLTEEEKKFDELVSNEDTDRLIDRYCVSETGALNAVAKNLGFDKRKKYESAVRKLLVDDETARNALRKRLSDLTQAIEKRA